MTALTRPVMTLLAAAAAGALLWVASQFDTTTTGGYWAAMGVVAAGGLLLALAQLRGRGGNPPGMFLFGFLPVLVVGLWVIITAQPAGNWFRSHLRTWDSNMGITGAVHDIAAWNGVIALGIGFACGLVLEPSLVARRREAPGPVAVVPPVTETRVVDEPAADEPLTAEREEVVARPARRSRLGRLVHH